MSDEVKDKIFHFITHFFSLLMIRFSVLCLNEVFFTTKVYFVQKLPIDHSFSILTSITVKTLSFLGVFYNGLLNLLVVYFSSRSNT